MKLPNLPKQNKKKEADFSAYFKGWIKRNKQITSSMEIKDTRGEYSFNFNEVSDKQIAFALAINSDEGVLIRTLGLNGEPDYIYMRNEPARIIIKYPRSFHIIGIRSFVFEKENSKRKSLTEDRAEEISIKTVKIK